MRAEQWLMIAVGGLGVYALYRIVTNKPSQKSTEEPAISIGPTTPFTPPALLQNIIGKAPAPAGSARLVRGTPYRGRLEIAPSSSRAQAQSLLQGFGFGDISVFMNKSEAEGDAIPLPDALANSTTGSRWFSGIWREPTTTKVLPRELVLLWFTASLPSSRPGTGHLASPFSPFWQHDSSSFYAG